MTEKTPKLRDVLDGIPTYKAADRLAEERITAIGKLKLPRGRAQPRFQAAAPVVEHPLRIGGEAHEG